MTREQLNANLDRTDISGIGVECVSANGSTVIISMRTSTAPQAVSKGL